MSRYWCNMVRSFQLFIFSISIPPNFFILFILYIVSILFDPEYIYFSFFFFKFNSFTLIFFSLVYFLHLGEKLQLLRLRLTCIIIIMMISFRRVERRPPYLPYFSSERNFLYLVSEPPLLLFLSFSLLAFTPAPPFFSPNFSSTDRL